jgi:hypothetical protein
MRVCVCVCVCVSVCTATDLIRFGRNASDDVLGNGGFEQVHDLVHLLCW